MILSAVRAELDRQSDARGKLTIAELSRRSGVNRVSLVNWISGKRGIGLDAAERVMRSLHLIVISASAPPSTLAARAGTERSSGSSSHAPGTSRRPA